MTAGDLLLSFPMVAPAQDAEADGAASSLRHFWTNLAEQFHPGQPDSLLNAALALLFQLSKLLRRLLGPVPDPALGQTAAPEQELALLVAATGQRKRFANH